MYREPFNDIVGYKLCRIGQPENSPSFSSFHDTETDKKVFNELKKWVSQRAVRVVPLTSESRSNVVCLGYHLEPSKPRLW